jgi:tRNA threonylcarbamoyladenosine biosynthesis protein TsaE
MGGHVVHVALKARLQPRQQPRLGLGEIDPGNADLGESELMRPPPQPRNELLPVEVMRTTHAPILETLDMPWPDEAACERFAHRLAAQPALRQAYLELWGPLGAGKTTFVRHLLRALGVQGRIKSPTYAVLEPHLGTGGLAIAHLDFYRFDDPREWADAGLRDVFAAPGLKLSEWADKVRDALPAPDLSLLIEPQLDDSARTVTLQAHSRLGLVLLEAA